MSNLNVLQVIGPDVRHRSVLVSLQPTNAYHIGQANFTHTRTDNAGVSMKFQVKISSDIEERLQS